MKNFIEKILGMTPWKPEWKDELSETLKEAQTGLSVNMIVVIARESDLYAEVLFLLSFLGLSLGSVGAYVFKHFYGLQEELIVLPLLGFALGSTLFGFRRFFINKMAPRAIRDRVAARAKTHFHNHLTNLKERVTLLYFSEMEREAIFLTSPDLVEKTPRTDVQKNLSQLVQQYDPGAPMVALRKALLSLAEALRVHFGPLSEQKTGVVHSFVFGASDQQPDAMNVPILKGNKDIN